MQATPMSFPDRDTVAEKLASFGDADLSFLKLLMENPQQDESLLQGIELYLHKASKAHFLNSLKLEKCGQWLGETAPDRLQIRLNETARQSQHPAYAAFKSGLQRSGGLEKAYPKAKI